MRYSIMAISLFFLPVVLSGPAGADTAGKAETAAFSEWAIDQAEALDHDWNRLTAAVTGFDSGIDGSILTGTGTAAGRSGSIRTAERNIGYSWKSGISSGGFIHKGISGEFMPTVTRERSGPTRGTGFPEHPASAGRAGNKLPPYGATNFHRIIYTGSNSAGLRGGGKNHPSMGSRFSTSNQRGAASSSLGASRIRKIR